MYYVGFSDDPDRRIIEHNVSDRKTFTSKHRPWIMRAKFLVGSSRSEAMLVEKYIKKRKSRKLIETIIAEQTNSIYIEKLKALALLVRVPSYGRD